MELHMPLVRILWMGGIRVFGKRASCIRGSLSWTDECAISEAVGITTVPVWPYYLCLGVDGTVYAAMDQSLIVRLKERDGTWGVAVTGMRDVALTAIDIDTADNIVVGSNVGKVYYSRNRGEQWDAIYSLSSSAPVAAVIWGRNGTIVAGTQGDGLFETKDTRRSWIARSVPGSGGFV